METRTRFIMRMLLPALLTTALTTLPAQSYVTSPPGIATVEGDSLAAYFGNNANWRTMILDGELRGLRRTLKQIALRPDYGDHAVTLRHNASRSWTHVVIDLAACDAARPSTTFSSNPLTTPTRVFLSGVSWPALVGRPTTKPAPWSLQFPFRQNWVHTGTRDVCIDYRFLGGTFTYQNRTYPLAGTYYFLDGHADDLPASQFRALTGPTQCRDSAMRSAGVLGGGAYSQTIGSVPMVVLRTGTVYTGNGPVAHAVSLTHRPSGLPFPGVTCQSLFLTGTPVVGVANTTPGRYTVHTFAIAPYASRYRGLKLYFQAGWNDSRTGAPRLTPAIESTVVPPSRGPFRRAAIDGWILNRQGTLSRHVFNLPVHRFTY